MIILFDAMMGDTYKKKFYFHDNTLIYHYFLFWLHDFKFQKSIRIMAFFLD